MTYKKRDETKKILLSIVEELEEADHKMEKILDLGSEAYIAKLCDQENIDFHNLGQATLLADDWIKKLGEKQ